MPIAFLFGMTFDTGLSGTQEVNGCEMKHKEFHKVKDHQTFSKVIRFRKLSFSSLYYIGKSQKAIF